MKSECTIGVLETEIKKSSEEFLSVRYLYWWFFFFLKGIADERIQNEIFVFFKKNVLQVCS